MKYYVLEDGRILSDISVIKEDIQYIEVDSYPFPIEKDGKISVVVGIKDGDLLWETREIQQPVYEEQEVMPEPTQLDKIEESQNIMLLALAEQYEKQQADNLVTMEAQAAIYEELLALKLQVGGVE